VWEVGGIWQLGMGMGIGIGTGSFQGWVVVRRGYMCRVICAASAASTA
jgi:hypothetical protein